MDTAWTTMATETEWLDFALAKAKIDARSRVNRLCAECGRDESALRFRADTVIEGKDLYDIAERRARRAINATYARTLTEAALVDGLSDRIYMHVVEQLLALVK